MLLVMENPQNLQGFVNVLVERVLDKLSDRLNQGPTGEPIPPLPDIPFGPQDTWPRIVHPKLHIQGLEITQSTQYYGTGYGTNNAVPIVALKPLVVRAYPYVTAGMFEGDALSGKTVIGELVLFRWGKEVYRTGPTRTSGARVGPSARLGRNLWDKETSIYYTSGKLGVERMKLEWNPSLNFVVPAWYLRAGQTTAAVRLWLTSGEGGMVDASESFQVISVNVPKVALVRVNWKNPATNVVTSPTDADLLGLCNLASRMLPFPYFHTTILGVEKTKSGDFSGPPPTPGGCNTAWNDLLTDLKVTRLFTVLFQIADIVYGVVPQVGALTVMGTQNTGCGWGGDGVGGCLVGDEVAFSHEVGHLYGCGHIGDPKLASYDPGYPNYGGSKTSIGEVGIDTALGATPLSDPASVHDLMSYKQPQWVSPYTYVKILNNRDMHTSAAADPRNVRTFLITAFTVSRLADTSRKIDTIKAHVVQGPGMVPVLDGTQHSNWSIDLIDTRDRVIANHACRIPTTLGGGGCGGCGSSNDTDRSPHLDFVEVMEWTDEVKRIQINYGESRIDSFEVGQAPTVDISGPEQREGSLMLRFSASHPQYNPSVVVLFTGDGGENWTPVAIDPPLDEPLAIDIASLSGGESCYFRVVATAEFHAAWADSDSFSLPRAERRLMIHIKEDYCQSGRVDFTAMIDVRQHESVGPQEVVWHSDIAGEIGRGYLISVDLEQGRHEITASIPGGGIDRVQATGIIIVGGRGR